MPETVTISSIRVTAEMKEKIRQIAAAEGRSINNCIAFLLNRAIKEYEAEKEK